MKRTLTLMLFSIIASMSAILYAGTPINRSELPDAALKFINKHFPGDNIMKAEKNQGRQGTEYDVDLASGAEIEFRDNGKWKEVKAAQGTAVPAAIIPEAIATFISTNFAGQSIVEISHKRGGYEVELSNGTELKLTKDAQPMPDSKKHNRGGNRR